MNKLIRIIDSKTFYRVCVLHSTTAFAFESCKMVSDTPWSALLSVILSINWWL